MSPLKRYSSAAWDCPWVRRQSSRYTLKVSVCIYSHLALTKSFQLLEGLCILHPSILVFTKLSPWSQFSLSTHPKSMRKSLIDRADIIFMFAYLKVNSLKIEFEKYTGKPKPVLFRLLVTFYTRLVEDDETGVLNNLKAAMYPESWDAMMTLPPLETESLLPPEEEPIVAAMKDDKGGSLDDSRTTLEESLPPSVN